jgi:autotransporter-associated beta strand protein
MFFESGSVSKIGTGTLTLSGASTHTGVTTVTAGTLVSNTAGSAIGSGPVKVNVGTLDGGGKIGSSVRMGTESGPRAVLAPAFSRNKQMTLTVQSSPTLHADATYTYTFKARRNQAHTDLVIANGVPHFRRDHCSPGNDARPIKAGHRLNGDQQLFGKPNQRRLLQSARRRDRERERE